MLRKDIQFHRYLKILLLYHCYHGLINGIGVFVLSTFFDKVKFNFVNFIVCISWVASGYKVKDSIFIAIASDKILVRYKRMCSLWLTFRNIFIGRMVIQSVEGCTLRNIIGVQIAFLSDSLYKLAMVWEEIVSFTFGKVIVTLGSFGLIYVFSV